MSFFLVKNTKVETSIRRNVDILIAVLCRLFLFSGFTDKIFSICVCLVETKINGHFMHFSIEPSFWFFTLQIGQTSAYSSIYFALFLSLKAKATAAKVANIFFVKHVKSTFPLITNIQILFRPWNRIGKKYAPEKWR